MIVVFIEKIKQREKKSNELSKRTREEGLELSRSPKDEGRQHFSGSSRQPARAGCTVPGLGLMIFKLQRHGAGTVMD
jgi:hypothetical protein